MFTIIDYVCDKAIATSFNMTCDIKPAQTGLFGGDEMLTQHDVYALVSNICTQTVLFFSLLDYSECISCCHFTLL